MDISSLQKVERGLLEITGLLKTKQPHANTIVSGILLRKTNYAADGMNLRIGRLY